MSEIPDGVDSTTAHMAIAWEITKRMMDKYGMPDTVKSADQFIDEFTRVYRKAYKQLSRSPEEK